MSQVQVRSPVNRMTRSVSHTRPMVVSEYLHLYIETWFTHAEQSVKTACSVCNNVSIQLNNTALILQYSQHSVTCHSEVLITSTCSECLPVVHSTVFNPYGLWLVFSRTSGGESVVSAGKSGLLKRDYQQI